MKSQGLSMIQMLDFRPDEGLIYLKGTRVLIMNADAMGTLRKELISTLGYERAKGFLIRYGWACGFNDALTIKEQYAWDNNLEWGKSGPVLHALEGIAHIDIEVLNVNPAERIFQIKCKATNSFEAEQHLRHFGTHDEPVCWMMIGYAGGYGSACEGERVFYKETKCIGKGDPYCEFIGKTMEEWGTDITDDLPYYDERKINEELETANRIIKKQHLQLQRALDIQEHLTNQVLSGEGLQGITKSLADNINGSVLVYDNRIRTLVSYIPESMLKYNLDRNIKEFVNNLMSSSIREQQYTILMTDKLPIYVDLVFNNQVYPSVFVPIVVKDEILGFITAVQRDKTDQDSIMAIKHSAGVYALELVKQKTIIDLEQLFHGEFLENLLLKTSSDESTLKIWALRLGHDISLGHNVIALGINYKKEDNGNLWINELWETINEFSKTHFPTILCGQLRNNLIFIKPYEDKSGKKNIIEFITRLREKIHMDFPQISVYLGISPVVNKIVDFPKSYSQALRALDIVMTFSKQDGDIFYEDLGSLALLFEANNKQELLEFMERKLSALIKHDKKYSSELLKTLEQYLDNKSIRETSKESALSVSGLKYRLNKIKELGYDLQSQQERLDLRLALNIWKLRELNEQ